jgi:hypothetical protein
LGAKQFKKGGLKLQHRVIAIEGVLPILTGQTRPEPSFVPAREPLLNLLAKQISVRPTRPVAY